MLIGVKSEKLEEPGTFNYSKIPILRPPLELSQRWSLIRGTVGVENEEK